MKFIANLRRQTLEAFDNASAISQGYLLSAHRITGPAIDMARRVRSLGLPLFADNGTKELIDQVIDLFLDRAMLLSSEVKDLRRSLRRVPRRRDIPVDLRKKAAALGRDVIGECTKLSQIINPRDLLNAQLSMDPTDVIAQEDFATTCLIALNLERELTGFALTRFATRNRRSLRLWRSVNQDPRCKGLNVYAVLSAMDYNTARAAGRLAAEAGVRSVAVGIASVTKDPSATDHYVMGKASVRLDQPVPQRYVRLAQILKGIADGFFDKSVTLERFHCLGLGAPSLLPIAAAAFDRETQVTTDATSPIHDAAKDRVLYDPEELGDRATTVEIVKRILDGGTWPFKSPFTKNFKDRFGHDPELARLWWEGAGRPEITFELLKESNDLNKALPLFSQSDPIIRGQARDVHIAHNHWVLNELASSRSGPARRDIALQIIDRWLSGEETVTTRGLRAAKQILVS